MPRDPSAARAAILAATTARLRHGGRDACTIASVALAARCAKGLVLYHFESKERLLAEAAREVARDRWARLAAALRGKGGPAAWESLWLEVLAEDRDGTARAYFEVLTAVPMPMDADRPFSDEVAGWLSRSGVSGAALDAMLAARAGVDGFSAALRGGVAPRDLEVAFLAFGIALLATAESPVSDT